MRESNPRLSEDVVNTKHLLPVVCCSLLPYWITIAQQSGTHGVSTHISMLRTIVSRFGGRTPSPSAVALRSPFQSVASFSSSLFQASGDHDVAREDMPYLHHKKRPRFKEYDKFKSPRKRASKLFLDLNNEAVEKSKASKPAVFEVDYRVGDSIECEVVEQGGVNATDLKRVRGIVIGKYNQGMDSAVLIRDVVMGTILERRLPLHSPMVKSIKLLERNFIYKGRRKVKRAKLYFLRDRNPNGTFPVVSLPGTMCFQVHLFVWPTSHVLLSFCLVWCIVPAESRVTKGKN